MFENNKIYAFQNEALGYKIAHSNTHKCGTVCQLDFIINARVTLCMHKYVFITRWAKK